MSIKKTHATAQYCGVGPTDAFLTGLLELRAFPIGLLTLLTLLVLLELRAFLIGLLALLELPALLELRAFLTGLLNTYNKSNELK